VDNLIVVILWVGVLAMMLYWGRPYNGKWGG
jgi:hypothetical protein